VRRQTKKQFISRLDGVKITGVQRRGKYLVLKLDSGELLVIHLRMSGQLLKAQPREAMPKHTHVVITFTQGGQLRFVDPRTFGELFVTAPDELTAEVPELAELGLDPVDEPMSWVRFGEMLLAKSTKLKPLLMDQSFLAGLGNIYSDEILWESGLRHDRTPRSLSTMEVRRLYRAIVEVLHEAIKHRGSTLADQQYVDLHGRPGEFQLLHQVYDREGQACRRCRTPIVREKLGQRSTFYCPNCQV
jgi:formamidopyrimidine-DNA glycosylase